MNLVKTIVGALLEKRKMTIPVVADRRKPTMKETEKRLAQSIERLHKAVQKNGNGE
jgi:hypothetical protein